MILYGRSASNFLGWKTVTSWRFAKLFANESQTVSAPRKTTPE